MPKHKDFNSETRFSWIGDIEMKNSNIHDEQPELRGVIPDVLSYSLRWTGVFSRSDDDNTIGTSFNWNHAYSKEFLNMNLSQICKAIHGKDFEIDEANPIAYEADPYEGVGHVQFVSRRFDSEHDILRDSQKHIEYVKLCTPGHECESADVQRTEFIIHDDKKKKPVSAGLIPEVQDIPKLLDSEDEEISFGDFREEQPPKPSRAVLKAKTSKKQKRWKRHYRLPRG